MKKSFTGLGSVVLAFALGSAGAAAAPGSGPLRQAETIALPNVSGRIDHFSADVHGRRLFISALGNHTVEVVDLADGKWERSLTGVEKPQGECYVGRLGKLFTADGAAGKVRVYRGSDLRLLATIPLDLGPDAEAYDPANRRLYVGYGGEDAGKSYGEVGIIDAVSNRHIGDIRTSAHPGAILVGHPGKRSTSLSPRRRRYRRSMPPPDGSSQPGSRSRGAQCRWLMTAYESVSSSGREIRPK